VVDEYRLSLPLSARGSGFSLTPSEAHGWYSTPEALARCGQVEAVRALVVEGGADATAVDELGETAKTLAVRKHHLAAAAAIDCARTAVALRSQVGPPLSLDVNHTNREPGGR
jgi:hypothetical protein